MAQRSYVPKFGNWDGDNVPYTAYFENARKEKASGVRINPNDPEENPEAFRLGKIRGNEINHTNSPDYSVQKKSPCSHKSMSSESTSDKSKSDNSLASIFKHRKRSERSKYSSESYSILPSPGPYTDDFSCRSVSVPRFGEWDEKDPKSAEGFTVIFEKVKEEKQNAAAKFTPVPSHTFNNYQTNQKKEIRPKKHCCGLF